MWLGWLESTLCFYHVLLTNHDGPNKLLAMKIRAMQDLQSWDTKCFAQMMWRSLIGET